MTYKHTSILYTHKTPVLAHQPHSRWRALCWLCLLSHPSPTMQWWGTSQPSLSAWLASWHAGALRLPHHSDPCILVRSEESGLLLSYPCVLLFALPSNPDLLPFIPGNKWVCVGVLGGVLSRTLGHWSRTFTQGTGQARVGRWKGMGSEVRRPAFKFQLCDLRPVAKALCASVSPAIKKWNDDNITHLIRWCDK